MSPAFQVVYSERQVADPNQDPIHGIVSPSASKPTAVAEALRAKYPGVEFVPPDRLAVTDFYRCHDRSYVDDILAKRRKNGFGTLSDSVNASLPYTNGAMFAACRLATPEKPACALVAGFHHAGYAGHEGLGYFCTFNGLMVSALKMLDRPRVERVAIVDCDMHRGNGTEDILDRVDLHRERILHISFGYYYNSPVHAPAYLESLSPDGGPVASSLETFRPQLIVYQSGADVHVDDPFGGVLTEPEMFERDRRVFRIARNLDLPVAWCLAGGYQADADGGIGTVVRLHLNTFEACEQVYVADRFKRAIA
jgi:acetoin utilization deacetylase AcuC-like enzyme